jgi:outer membrane protein TolC
VLTALLVGAGATPALAQTPAPLTLAAAEQLAVAHNRQVETARLDVERVSQALAGAWTDRLPRIQLQSLSGTLVSPIDVLFPEGILGTFPATGPIPAEDRVLRADPWFSSLLYAQIAQPLTQQRAIGFGTRALEARRDAAREQVLVEEAEVLHAVRRAYFGLVETQAARRSAQEALVLARELERLMAGYLEREVVLAADAMAAQAWTVEQEQRVASLERAFASLAEQLNVLIGRDIEMPVDVVPMAADLAVGPGVEAAEALALERRPELRQARLRFQEAEANLQRVRAEAIPEVSAVFNYVGIYNVDLLPRHVAALGVLVTWRPLDWGRRDTERATGALAVEQAAIAVRRVEDGIRLEVRQRARLLEEARAALCLAELGVNIARERLRVAAVRFRVDANLQREVLEAQTGVAAAELAFETALNRFWTAQADFDKATGETS